MLAKLICLMPLLAHVDAFHLNSHKSTNRKNGISMKWAFEKGSGSLQDLGAVGSDGEYYFHPAKPATLKTPVPLGKTTTVPIFPFSSVLIPTGTESIQVLEMQNRQLFYEVGDGVFGFVYLNPQAQKVALVGTLARIKHRKLLEDGRSFLVVEGISRFYLKTVLTDKPYIKAKIQAFEDYTEDEASLDALELQIFDEVRFNVKLMELLFPHKNYSIGPNILQNRPSLKKSGIRSVKIADPKLELERRTRFSFAILDILQIKPSTKLMLLQEPVIEKRYRRVISVLESGSEYLKQELRNRGVLTEQGIMELRKDILADTGDIESIPESAWVPENYRNGEWTQLPVLM